MSLQWSVAAWSFIDGSTPLSETLQQLGEAGVDFVEMISADVRSALGETGVRELNMAGPGIEKGPADPSLHESLADEFKAKIREAQKNGVPHLIAFTGNLLPDQSEDDAQAACIDFFRAVTPLAAEAGVTLVLENFCEQNHPGYLGISIDRVLCILDAVGHESLSWLYDAYHASQAGFDAVAIGREHARRIAHVHLAEPPNRTAPLPQGNLKSAELVQSMTEQGYRGAFGLEFMPSGDRLSAGLAALRALQDSVR